MTTAQQIDEKMCERIQAHAIRFYNIQKCIDFLTYSFEMGAHDKTVVELYCFGAILKDYIKHTKEALDQIEKELGTA